MDKPKLEDDGRGMATLDSLLAVSKWFEYMVWTCGEPRDGGEMRALHAVVENGIRALRRNPKSEVPGATAAAKNLLADFV